MPRSPSRQRHRKRSAQPGPLLIGGGLVVVAIAVSVLIAVFGASNGDQSTAGRPDLPAPAATTSGVQVAEPSVDLGRVPLDTIVNHSFVLKNATDRPVELGVAAIEVLDGC